MRTWFAPWAASAVACVLVASASANTRLKSSSGYELRWGQPSNVGIVIQRAGSDDLADESHVTAIQNAIRAWNEAPGSAARLIENASAGARARTDWPSDDLHLVLFDEDGSSGYFPIGTGIVALTPVWFTASGVISDADVLFNGRDFTFTTSGDAGAFDVQDVATHELGHLLGLDHSGWAGATMYPYVDPAIVLHRSISEDEVSALRTAYPAAPFGALAGVVRYPDDDYVGGAHVVALDANGRTRASTLTSNLGAFTLRGLAPGTYSLYATPFEAPVSAANLSGNHGIQVDFRTTAFGSFGVTESGTTSIGNRTVLADTSLGLGRTSDDLPVRCVIGRTRTVTLHGSNLAPGSALETSDASVTVAPLAWNFSQVTFQVTVPDDEALGHVDLTVVNAVGQRSTLVAALEITPPDPTVASVTPARGSFHGGDEITLRGTGFRPRATVVIGERVYVEGLNGCTRIDGETLRLTTASDRLGARDVVVIDPSGVEGRLAHGFTFEALPGITNVFPGTGSSSGGTTVVLSGQDFVAGCTVSIGGVVQTSVDYASDTRLVVTTSPGVPGGPYTVEVANPLGETATALFSYASAPDPIVTAIDPASGSDAGGSVVTIHGAHFTSSCEVVFGADANTGAGGALSSEIEFVDAHTLRVVSPPFASGTRSVVVRDPLTQQAAVVPSGFVYQSSKSPGGGCASIGPHGGDDRWRGASGFAAIGIAFAWLLLRARASRPHAA